MEKVTIYTAPYVHCPFPDERKLKGSPRPASRHRLTTALKQCLLLLRPDVVRRNPIVLATALALGFSLVLTSAKLLGLSGPVSGKHLLTLDAVLLLAFILVNFTAVLAQARATAGRTWLESIAGEPMVYRLLKNGEIEQTLQPQDKIVVDSGRVIPADGQIVQGYAAVDESAITGQSSPVIREAGGDRSEVIGGTRVLRGHIVVLLKKVFART
jgi:K+-transporting ATPase ATPase B chain